MIQLFIWFLLNSFALNFVTILNSTNWECLCWLNILSFSLFQPCVVASVGDRLAQLLLIIFYDWQHRPKRSKNFQNLNFCIFYWIKMPATFVTQNNLKNIDIDYESDNDPIFKTSNGKQRFGIKYCLFFKASRAQSRLLVITSV